MRGTVYADHLGSGAVQDGWAECLRYAGTAWGVADAACAGHPHRGMAVAGFTVYQ